LTVVGEHGGVSEGESVGREADGTVAAH